MEDSTSKDFLNRIFTEYPRQKKSVEVTLETYFGCEEWRELEDILNFYVSRYGMEYVVESYLLIVEDTARETKFFLENNRYRYISFAEVEKLVYANDDYMSRYMVGLAISDYLWLNHIKITKWFTDILKRNSGGGHYLEVGPGHGHYFKNAILYGDFEDYDAIDISNTSVMQTKAFVEYCLTKGVFDDKKVEVFRQDCYTWQTEKKYDFVVIAEVLEHLETPDIILKKLHELMSDAGYLYATIPINAPAIDYIYQFVSIEDVEDMIRKAGFEIIESVYSVAGDMELEKAIKRKMPL